ncbi:ALK and LTK ligand 2 isoform X1 [Prionailurus viverrinus]|uniref:ALK and LTK ligand 2 isoform X1 n=1 Tax=Prionailurus viverrinus TaxID=61388 RepID=UPI001FF421D7|nr:ALK and LTK ligand 2 isoform X1 [Prionailurus viverrinus]
MSPAAKCKRRCHFSRKLGGRGQDPGRGAGAAPRVSAPSISAPGPPRVPGTPRPSRRRGLPSARGPRGPRPRALPAPPPSPRRLSFPPPPPTPCPCSARISLRPSERTMRGPGRPLLLGLLLVLGAAGPGVAAPREAADGQTLLRLIAEILQELRKGQAGEAKRLQLAGRREASDSALDPEEQRVEIVPRDLRMKDKFLKHLTGPLYFSPKCSKHFHRLYHNTRDCTVPAYYKRCARLLTRLAVSPMCLEG